MRYSGFLLLFMPSRQLLLVPGLQLGNVIALKVGQASSPDIINDKRGRLFYLLL